MPEIVHSLLRAPELWVLAALVVSGVGTWWLVRRERRRPSSYPHSPERLARMAQWRSLSTRAQAARDRAAILATDPDPDAGVEPVVRTAELIVFTEYARSIAER